MKWYNKIITEQKIKKEKAKWEIAFQQVKDEFSSSKKEETAAATNKLICSCRGRAKLLLPSRHLDLDPSSSYLELIMLWADVVADGGAGSKVAGRLQTDARGGMK